MNLSISPSKFTTLIFHRLAVSFILTQRVVSIIFWGTDFQKVIANTNPKIKAGLLFEGQTSVHFNLGDDLYERPV